MLLRMCRKGNLLHGCWGSGIAAVRNSMEIAQKVKNGAINTI